MRPPVVFSLGTVTARAVDQSWHPTSIAISELLECTVDSIVDDEHQWRRYDNVDVSNGAIQHYELLRHGSNSEAESQDEGLQKRQIKELIAQAINTMTPR